MIGSIDVVNKYDDKLCAELGWVIGDDYWGRGIMPEAARCVLQQLFDVGYYRVQALHHFENKKSGRVMSKIGMEYEGMLKKYDYDRDGNLVDICIWAIIND